jgi:hypothetical protein
MTMQELLKSIEGLSDDQIKAILDGMKKGKIFTASEENLDVRYGKLKADHESLTAEHQKSTDLIADLQKKTKSDEAVQKKIAEYQTQIQTLQQEAIQAKTESALKIALLTAGAKSSDIDYLMFKIQHDGDWSPELGEDGQIKGLEDKVKGLKTQFPAQFDSASSKKVDEKKLDRTDQKESVTADEFRKMGYQAKNELFNRDPDLYRKLSGKGE